jgi:hypothetical protein
MHFLLENGANKDAKDKVRVSFGYPPLPPPHFFFLFTLSPKHFFVLKCGCTSLHLAAERGHISIMKHFLLNDGADKDANDNVGSFECNK